MAVRYGIQMTHSQNLAINLVLIIFCAFYHDNVFLPHVCREIWKKLFCVVGNSTSIADLDNETKTKRGKLNGVLTRKQKYDVFEIKNVYSLMQSSVMDAVVELDSTDVFLFSFYATKRKKNQMKISWIRDRSRNRIDYIESVYSAATHTHTHENQRKA